MCYSYTNVHGIIQYWNIEDFHSENLATHSPKKVGGCDPVCFAPAERASTTWSESSSSSSSPTPQRHQFSVCVHPPVWTDVFYSNGSLVSWKGHGATRTRLLRSLHITIDTSHRSITSSQPVPVLWKVNERKKAQFILLCCVTIAMDAKANDKSATLECLTSLWNRTRGEGCTANMCLGWRAMSSCCSNSCFKRLFYIVGWN